MMRRTFEVRRIRSIIQDIEHVRDNNSCVWPHERTDSTIVDSEWLSRAISYDFSTPPTQLVYEFALAHPIETLPADTTKYDQPYLNITTVNLDDDPDPEHIMFIGTDPSNSMFCVIKRFGDHWKLIHYEYLWLHNESPELILMNTPSQHKTFYVRWLYHRGSGAWLFTYRFYKVVEGKLILALEFIDDSLLQLGALDLNGRFTTTSIADYEGSLFIKFRYELSTGYWSNDTVHSGNESPRSILLMSDEHQGVFYEWEPSELRFVLRKSSQSKNLDQSQIDCFMHLEKEVTCISALETELHNLESSNDSDKRRIAKYLLSKLKK